jgi:hypothetical protein
MLGAKATWSDLAWSEFMLAVSDGDPVMRYFMQLRDGTEQMLDPEGLEYADLDELRKRVLIAARDMLSEDIRGGVIDLRFRIDAEDRGGAIVYTLGFAEAVNIIPDDK